MKRKSENEKPQGTQFSTFQLYSPKEIRANLDKYVIGQDEAKKILSVAIYNHYKRLLSSKYGIGNDKTEFRDVKIEKSNVMLLGNTGSGKTFLIQTIAKMLGVPLFVQDCTKLTESGYVGEDVENCVGGLLRAVDFDVDRAEMGIVVLDEVDKLAKQAKGNMSITRDVGGEGVQQGLLKIVEGSVVGVPPQGGRKHPDQKLVHVDTSNILFIALGAFSGLEKAIERRFSSSSVGFKSQSEVSIAPDRILDKVTHDDLKNFGLIPEFIGRFPVLTHTNPLKVNDMVRIITEPKNSLLKQYQKLMSMDNVTLKFSDEAIRYIAEVAITSETGARGLRGVMERILTDVMYEYAETERSKTLTIDRAFVENILSEREMLYGVA